ncbi:ThiF family adenylyltransferase, partial [Mycobacterium tuberculosis]|nr:ThiF family adenylyltransferase [Mycobacterium tuberculosis]
GDIGRAKVEAAGERLADLNPHVSLDLAHGRVTADTVDELVAGADIVVDGTDNFPTRFLVADACERAETPLVAAAVREFYGTLTTLMPYA